MNECSKYKEKKLENSTLEQQKKFLENLQNSNIVANAIVAPLANINNYNKTT